MEEDAGDQLDNPAKVGRRKRMGSRISASILFSVEDMTTDSTSVLKDMRHPSVSTISQVGSTGVPGGPGGGQQSQHQEVTTGRVVKLDRSISSAASYRRRRSSNFIMDRNKSGRQRYMSEGDREGNQHHFRAVIRPNVIESSGGSMSTLIASNVGSRFKLSSPRAGSLYSGLDLGMAGAPTPLLVGDLLVNMDQQKDKKDKDPDTIQDDKAAEDKKKPGLPKRVWLGINKYLDLTLVKEPLFIIMALSVMCMSVGVPHVLFFVPTHAKGLKVGADPAVLLSATSIADLVGRIAFGIFLDANLVPKHFAYATMILVSGLSVMGLSLANSYWSLCLTMVFYGIGVGSWFLMVPLLLADFLGVERIGSSYGLVRLFQAMSNFIGPLIAGLVWDGTGSFSYAFLSMGIIMSIGCGIVLLKGCIEREKKLEPEIEDNDAEDVNKKNDEEKS